MRNAWESLFTSLTKKQARNVLPRYPVGRDADPVPMMQIDHPSISFDDPTRLNLSGSGMGQPWQSTAFDNCLFQQPQQGKPQINERFDLSEIGLSMFTIVQPQQEAVRAFLLLLWPQIEIDYAGTNTNVCQSAPDTTLAATSQSQRHLVSQTSLQLTGADTTLQSIVPPCTRHSHHRQQR